MDGREAERGASPTDIAVGALRVLIVEDSPTDAKLILAALRRGGREIESTRVDSAEGLRAALDGAPWDVITCDWAMPGFSGPAALAQLRATGLDIPFIIVSGTVGEELAVDAMRAGARDYVIKDRLARLAPAVERELGEARLRAIRKAEEALHRISEARFRALWESGIIFITITGPEGNIIDVNDGFARVLGYARAELVSRGMRWAEITPPEWHAADDMAVARAVATGAAPSWEKELIAKDGRRVPILAGAVMLGGGELIAIGIDLTERKQVDRALYERMRIATLTAEVGSAVTHEDTLGAMLQRCAEAVVEQLGAALARIWTLDAPSQMLQLAASAGLFSLSEGGQAHIAVGDAGVGLIAQNREPRSCSDLRHDPQLGDPDWVAREGLVTFAGYPMIVGGELVGVVAIYSRDTVTDAARQGVRAVVDAIAVGTQRQRAQATRESLEAQLRQAHKLEAIGSLAGGVAHDFNNVLSVILSYSDFVAADLPPESHLHADIAQITAAGQRAAGLTRQLLAFSRQQVLQPRVLNLNSIVRDLRPMLRRLVPEDVELAIIAGSSVGNVNADPGQLEQVLMNLVVNARDAMPTGGALTITTSAVELDAAFVAAHVGVVPGPHVLLEVSDTGIGMSAKVRSRVFEPFFTTKDVGHGTGLGLATVFGIVRQSGGSIWVQSEPGVGTKFSIYLPTVEGVAAAAVHVRASEVETGSETILLCEDDDAVRGVVRAILTKSGYRVLEAQNAGEAVLLCEQHPRPIHLLLTDVVMPILSGRELAERVQPIRPAMKLLFMSGYTDDAMVRHGVSNAGTAFLQKPITPESLAKKVREVLDVAPETG